MDFNSSEIKLGTKLVGAIEGDFFVPSYQRGYRWGIDEVTRLLDDIYTNGAANYCLQPVVVKRSGDKFELIDGQQRLTTLFILLQYIKKEFKPKINIKYTLSYDTREKSAEYLCNIDEKRANEYIDFYHIYQAYKTIENWINSKEDPVVVADDLYGYLVKYVNIIWYEVGEEEKDAVGLFTRLNIGKIPLTSAELVKAMFLSDHAKMGPEKQEEIALQWDTIEKELHNDSLWGFLTNYINLSYQTRIDLILDLIADKPKNSKEKYFTFFYFDSLRNKGSLDETWKRIQHTFLILRDWYENHDLYHKIGYLIAADLEDITLADIFKLSQGKNKHVFEADLDDLIRESIKIDSNYADLSYKNPTDYDRISRLLLLFNVESVHQIDGQTQRFPFDRFKCQKSDKVTWSLEHIHAQQSESLQKQEQWREWLKLHIPFIRMMGGDNAALVEEMQQALDKQTLDGHEFEEIQKKAIARLSVQSNNEYEHSIANLALLNTADNAALNNSTFAVKRNYIVDMDKAGQYLPFCTKMVFLKYYTPSDKNQLYFWGQADRVAYVENINRVLEKYLPEKISVEKEVNL